MCGIAGFLNGDWGPEALDTMRDSLAHRGPDDSGQYYDQSARIGLAHTRLSIIGLSTGHQPLANRDGTVQVIFNGEIYNYKELRRELQAKGHIFRTDSDTEVIPYLYEELGADFVKRLRGMFAIALWDARKKRLLLIRDRFGIKPLYFKETPEGLIFASEIKALLAVEPASGIDPQAMRWYLAFRYVPENITMFSGIKKLEPGHFLDTSPRNRQIVRYWTLEPTHNLDGRTEASIAEELRARLSEAVELRLMSEVPLGSFLSGGLDSSFIVGLMSKLMNQPVKTFSFGVGSGWHNESKFANLAAERFATDHYPLTGDCNDKDTFERTVWSLDEPLADAAIIPTYLLSELTRQHVTVVLTGEGADELLGGYDKYKALSLAAKLKPFAKIAAVASALCRKMGNLSAHRAAECISLSADLPAAYIALVSVFSEAEKGRLITPELQESLRHTEPPDMVIRRALRGRENLSILDQLMHIDVATWLPNDVLLKADKMSMAHSLEARVPFLDHEFAEFAASIPSTMKLKWMREKHILRLAMKNLVPDEIIKRRKHGFTVSLNPWRGSASDPGLLETVLSDSRTRSRNWFRPEALAELQRQPLDNAFARRQIFTVLMAEQWASIHLDNGSNRSWCQ